jgi:hypothetical protein
VRRDNDIIALVTRDTRLEGLKRRRATAGAAKFALGQVHAHERERRANLRDENLPAAATLEAVEALASFTEYRAEAQAVTSTEEFVRRELDLGYPVTLVDRDYLPNFDFGRCVLAVVVGQDGLVANTAKYVGDVPIVGVNPDPVRNDGILLPFAPQEVRRAVRSHLDGEASLREVTLAEVNLNDGQRLLAFNDLFIGSRTHTSARYTIAANRDAEAQSSSGIIISTGAGSTGWLSSIFNMARGVGTWLGNPPAPAPTLAWEDRRLLWAVREPFVSKHSSARLVMGVIDEGEEITLESLMPSNGVIFSDGIERDALEFTSGSLARITVSSQRARLVVPG